MLHFKLLPFSSMCCVVMVILPTSLATSISPPSALGSNTSTSDSGTLHRCLYLGASNPDEFVLIAKKNKETNRKKENNAKENIFLVSPFALLYINRLPTFFVGVFPQWVSKALLLLFVFLFFFKKKKTYFQLILAFCSNHTRHLMQHMISYFLCSPPPAYSTITIVKFKWYEYT